MPDKRLVLDANILLRGVFGVRVYALLREYEGSIAFCAPDICFEDALRYIPPLAARRGSELTATLQVLEKLKLIVEQVDPALYQEHEHTARARMARRDLSDWPIVATAIFLDCPIWTEDRDFFGGGIATWTTATIELYLKAT